MKNTTEYYEVLTAADKFVTDNIEYRLGQAIWNICHDRWPSLVSQTRGNPELSCFQNDQNINKFLNFIFETSTGMTLSEASWAEEREEGNLDD